MWPCITPAKASSTSCSHDNHRESDLGVGMVLLPEDSMLSDCMVATVLLPLYHACQGFQHFLQP